MTAIVHFGMPKTGTTSIQSTLFRFAKRPRSGFVYLSADGHFNGNRVSKLLCRSDSRAEKLAEDDPKLDVDSEGLAARQADVRATLAMQIAAAKSKPVIFSSEDLIYADEQKLANFRELFLPAGQAPRGVGYIRSPKSLIESFFQQNVKTRAMQFSMARLYPNYRETFEKFERVFGRDNMEYWLFDPKKFPDGCVVQDFAGRVGIDVSGARVVRRNDALSRPALSLFLAYRKYAQQKRSANAEPSRLLETLQGLEGTKLRFHSSIIAPVLEEKRDDMAWMEDRLGASLNENLEADDAIAARSEDDLLAFEPETLQWLSDMLADEPLSQRVLSGDPEVVAQGVARLRELLARPGKFARSTETT